MSEFRALLPSFLPGVELNEQKNSQFSTERVSFNRHLRIKKLDSVKKNNLKAV